MSQTEEKLGCIFEQHGICFLEEGLPAPGIGVALANNEERSGN